MVEQTVYKKEGAALANYMKYNYKYNDQKRMTESKALKWNANNQKWENSLRITYTYEGKTVTTNYYKWNSKKNAYILVPERQLQWTIQISDIHILSNSTFYINTTEGWNLYSGLFCATWNKPINVKMLQEI